ncbi:MAG TPA: ornithine carbamoyltransferase [Candidatus Omnitrophica bacterium]|nr:MAG: ornithine carbamoyltransferase [Omnitrophica WOR_2 bacterium GWA2_63_20]OGX17349.1 MAG: ornithine carbamoyltransferase [Omnitrophica WOR_2 bacterium GWF2_63_9]OGX30745.1 MAG: ornithine carbamoyltransferase [Omnitrophica WOR_2 bacterium RIFCSPHIGHO2_12_FULL_64_13]OGX36595.1 MAG: ornithine carbamoyltransferase [Omnitrophica WOR_2 bacterium RIFCSPHIGHO2_02_FULL_63_39]OGX46023.1 MAG: ornithine carbamoyltransferase [Omnitrophica WOR_2 bacterium RIFCSPLOWO2_02_FULL_63_16]OGX47341.1 MAG: orni
MKKDFLTLASLTAGDLRRLLALAARCKRSPRACAAALSGKTLALVFQKPSVRTRVSFEVAIRRLGGSAIYLGPDDVYLGKREPTKDVARTLARYVDAIVARTFSHKDVEALAHFACVPVINGLSDLHHPCQALADFFTMSERCGRLRGITLAYIGDGNNVLHSLAEGATLLGVTLRVATPARYRPQTAIWKAAVKRARRTGARLMWSDDPREVAAGADVVYTDVWTSMGYEREQAIRRRAFRAFQVDEALLRVAKRRCLVMHCLPAHRGEEITDEVVEGPRSIVFDQAENRLHVQQALLLTLLGKDGGR